MALEVGEASTQGTEEVLARLGTTAEGLTTEEAERRFGLYGPNGLARDQRPGFGRMLLRAFLNPLVLLLSSLALLSAATGDLRSSVVMVTMIALGVGLKLVQESKADRAALALKNLISVKATVLRDRRPQEIEVVHLVPGDVVQLSAGDMVPGDVRLLHARDLFVNQGALTGESFPVEKNALPDPKGPAAGVDAGCIAFLGTSIASGSATAVVVVTGSRTYLGGMAEVLGEHPIQTAFDRGIARFTVLMLRFMAVLVPLVFVLNVVTKGSVTEAFFFALAVAVGLTPEMLPMIVTVCLSKGAVAMGRKKVIVKRLPAIQNLGAMDVLCTDKTGTLTQDRVILERHCDVRLHESDAVLALAYLNSHFQTGLKSVLDRAILAHEETHDQAQVPKLEKVDEIPFDFERRLLSVVVRTVEGRHLLISKGAPESIFPRCKGFELEGQLFPIDHDHMEGLQEEVARLSAEGFRVLALATKDMAPRELAPGETTLYGKADERDLVLQGYVAFLDPPRESARAALEALSRHGVTVKVLTGDNERVTRKVCKDVGISTEELVVGDELEGLEGEALSALVERTTVFARVSPTQKLRILEALKARGHTVGFLGDGINDAPALHAADVGISVDTAVDIARESADILLLERSLLVVDEGVVEGRKVYANILKYVRMGASSNFGNMFSVLGASVFVPFLPMQPLQILANNLIYDLGQTAVPTDSVDEEQLLRPHPWDIASLTRFILWVGPCSSIFDYTTFFVLLYGFGCRDVSTPEAAARSTHLFQTGWFVESLLTQTLIIHVIRTNRIPFLESRASPALLAMGGVTALLGLWLPSSPLGPLLGFVPLPGAYWPVLLGTLLGYMVLTQWVKTHFLRRWGWG